MKEQILKLKSEGKSYREIQKILGCSKGTISYHCGNGQKEKTTNRQRQLRKDNTLIKKVDRFKNPDAFKKQRRKIEVNSNSKKLLRHKTDDFQRDRISKNGESARKHGRGDRNITFNYHDIIEKFGPNPKCYLTGRTLDLTKPRTYNFDHIIPASKAGTLTLDNLGIACKEANAAKSDMLIPELLQLCKEILEHNGYEVLRK